MRVRGTVSPKTRSVRRLSEAAIAALESGDTEELIRINRAEFGGWTMMADADDDDDEDDTDDDDEDADAGGKKKSKSGSDSGADDDDDDDDDDGDDVQAQLAAIRKRMKAADRRANAAEKALRDKEREGQDESTRVKADLEEARGQVKELSETVTNLRLQNAFLTANKHTWHDPDVALSLAQSKKYLEDVVDEDGEVDKKALKSALDRLAKEHAYLVKVDKKSKDDDDQDNPPSSGEPAGRRSNNDKDADAKREQLRRRFPALR